MFLAKNREIDRLCAIISLYQFWTKNREIEVSEEQEKKKLDLRSLEYFPAGNPLLEAGMIPVKRKKVKSGLSDKTLTDIETGEVIAASVIHQIEEKDEAQFVKVFADGIAASYGLSKTAQKVFFAVLKEYENTPMTGGFADTIYLAWFDKGLCGHSIGMAQKTFNTGLKELLQKQFLAARGPNTYWVNPALFFKGDRVLFVKEYRRQRPEGELSVMAKAKRKKDDENSYREKLEAAGQQRIEDAE